jgi:hypothetical protein
MQLVQLLLINSLTLQLQVLFYFIYLIQHYVIKFISYLRQVGGFLQVLWFPPPIKKTDRHDITEILLKVALNTINQPFYFIWNRCLNMLINFILQLHDFEY